MIEAGRVEQLQGVESEQLVVATLARGPSQEARRCCQHSLARPRFLGDRGSQKNGSRSGSQKESSRKKSQSANLPVPSPYRRSSLSQPCGGRGVEEFRESLMEVNV